MEGRGVRERLVFVQSIEIMEGRGVRERLVSVQSIEIMEGRGVREWLVFDTSREMEGRGVIKWLYSIHRERWKVEESESG